MRWYAIALFVAVLLLASCTPPEPPPTYTVFLDDGIVVFSAAAADLRAHEHFSIPLNAERAYVLYLNDSRMHSRDGREGLGSWTPVDPGYAPSMTVPFFVRIVFEWNGTLPNVTFWDADVYVANTDRVVRATTPGSRIATTVPWMDVEDSLRSVSGDPRTLEHEGETAAFLYRTRDHSIGLDLASNRWQLIRPGEYVMFAVVVLCLIVLSILPACIALKLGEHRFLVWGPLAFGTVGAVYQLVATFTMQHEMFKHVFGVDLLWLVVSGWFVGFLLGPSMVWRRFGLGEGLLSMLLSILWVPVVLLVFGLLFIAFLNIRAVFF